MGGWSTVDDGLGGLGGNSGNSGRGNGFNGNGRLTLSGGFGTVTRRGSNEDEKNWGGS